MDIERTSKDTLTTVELDVEDRLRFTLADGQQRTIVVRAASAEVESRGRVWGGEENGIQRFRIAYTLEIDGHLVQLVRTIPSAQNCAAPSNCSGTGCGLTPRARCHRSSRTLTQLRRVGTHPASRGAHYG